MLASDIDQIDETLLRAACNERWSESQTLDFKRDLPGTDDRSRNEFLKDVCAFANADGGDLVYGVQDQSGSAERAVPISTDTAPVDATKRRLGQLLETRLEPRVQGIEMRAVTLSSGGYVLIVRVPPSFQRPHRYQLKDQTRWVMRSDTHTADMSYEQIRTAFDRGATLVERARQFRENRLTAITSLKGIRIRPGPLCVVQVIPLGVAANRDLITVRDLYRRDYLEFTFGDWGTPGRNLNLDGLLVYPNSSSDASAYTQVFRSGAMEATRFAGRMQIAREEDKTAIASLTISAFIRDGLYKFFDVARRLRIGGPAIAGVSLLNVAGWKWWFQAAGQVPESKSSDRSQLILPEMWIEQLGAVSKPEELIRQILDALWQAFDLEQCMFYDANGTWISR